MMSGFVSCFLLGLKKIKLDNFVNMKVEQILTKLVSYPILGGQSNMTILSWIKEYLESYGLKINLVPNKNENTIVSCIASINSLGIELNILKKLILLAEK